MDSNSKDLRQKTVSGVFWRFAERFSAQLISLLVSIVLARILMPEEYGAVAIVTIFIALANTFVTSGLGTALVQDKKASDKEFSTIFHASIVLSLVLYAVIFMIAPIVAQIYDNETLVPLLRVMGLKLPIAAVSSVQQAYVMKKMIYKKFFFATIVGTIASAFVGIWLAYHGFGAWALVAQYLTNSVIDMIVLGLTIDWRPKLYFSWEKFKGLFGYGWKIMASSFLGTFFDQLKSLLVGAKYTAGDLAYYNKADQFPSIVKDNLNLTFDSVFFSTLSVLQDDMGKLRNAVSKMMKISSFLSLPILIGLGSVASTFVSVVLTDKWLPMVPIMQIFCFQHCFSIISTINLQTIKSIGRSDVVLKLELIKKPLYVGFILVGLLFGPMGVAVGNMIYGIIGTVINMLPNRKLVGYKIGKQIADFLPFLLISIAMGVIVMLVGTIDINIFAKLILQVLVGIGSYLLLSFLFVRTTFEDAADELRSLVKRRAKK